jgi:hypothetical protein
VDDNEKEKILIHIDQSLRPENVEGEGVRWSRKIGQGVKVYSIL